MKDVTAVSLLVALIVLAGPTSAQESLEAAENPRVLSATPSLQVTPPREVESAFGQGLLPTARAARLVRPLASQAGAAATAGDLEAVVVQARDRRGLPFMIAGGAAFVAGLIIGSTTGNAVAAGGVVLGVYGIILYF